VLQLCRTAALRAASPPRPAPADDTACCIASYALLSGAEAWRCVSLCVVVRRIAGRRCTGLRATAISSAFGCCWSAARTRRPKTRCAPPRMMSLSQRAVSERGTFGTSLVTAFVRRRAAPLPPPPRAPLCRRTLGPSDRARCAPAARRSACSARDGAWRCGM
jgi:hypothetical protein